MGSKISKPKVTPKQIKETNTYLCQQCEEESLERFEKYNTFNLENNNNTNYSYWEKNNTCNNIMCLRHKK